MTTEFLAQEPTREAVDGLQGATVLEFGTPWCGHCNRARPLVSAALAEHPGVRHLKVEDGAGRALGRTYQVKLWPTLVFLREGREVARLVRPTDAEAVRQALTSLETPAA